MEKEITIPQADKLVGIPKETRPESIVKLKKKIDEAYEFYGNDKIQDLELEKTEKDLQIIKFVNEAIREYLGHYGREVKNDTPLGRIHILKKGGTEKFTEGVLRSGGHSLLRGTVLVDRNISDAQFAIVLFHEQLHNNCYKALQITKSKEPKLEEYRSGFSATSRDGKIIHFYQLEEAVISILTQRFYEEKIKSSDLFKGHSREQVEFSYQEEIENLNKLIDDLWEANKKENGGKFVSRKEIEDLFIDAQINGRLLAVGKLIEKTFGQGSFRKLGEKSSY